MEMSRIEQRLVNRESKGAWIAMGVVFGAGIGAVLASLADGEET